MSDLVGPEIDKFLAEIPYKLLEPPWNTSIAIDNGWKVCYTTKSHFQIKFFYYVLDFFPFVIAMKNTYIFSFYNSKPGTFLYQGHLFSLFLYDATYLYLLLLNEILAEGKDPKNGTLIFEKSKNRTFYG